MPLKSWLKFVYLGVVWGATYLWLKIGIQELEPITLNAIRLTMSSIGILLILRLTHSPWPGRKILPFLAFLAIFNIALPFTLITWSEKYITTGLASVLNSTLPLFTILLAAFFVPDDNFSLARGAGLVLGFGGVVLLVSDKLNGGSGGQQLGAIVMLVASLSTAIAAIFARRKLPEIPPVTIAFGQAVFASMALWPLALAVESPLHMPQRPLTWIALVWLSILATGVGTILYYYLLREVGPTRTTLTAYIFPLVGVLLGWVFLSEQPDWRLVVGGFLVISGVALVNARSARKKVPLTETDGSR